MTELDTKRLLGPLSDADVAGHLLAAAKPQADIALEAALLERIMAAAERTPRLAAVATLPKQQLPMERALAVASARRGASSRDLWKAASVLAASLVIGFVAGQSSLPHAAVHRVAEASGLSLASATHDVASVLAGAEHGDDD
jgi:hypothetical protein